MRTVPTPWVRFIRLNCNPFRKRESSRRSNGLMYIRSVFKSQLNASLSCKVTLSLGKWQFYALHSIAWLCIAPLSQEHILVLKNLTLRRNTGMSHVHLLTQIATENGLGPAAEIKIIKYSVSGVLSISDGNWRMFSPYFNFKRRCEHQWVSKNWNFLALSRIANDLFSFKTSFAAKTERNIQW